ncbi:MAG: hypothetical protein K9M54_13465 [Kiritimatiellales bacterium]|nr:hypothetical protein [Kiritimatiellales bacterium]
MAAACPNKTENLEHCTCTYDCGKCGVCCECVAYHRAKGQIPGCFFSREGEASWDRSVRKLCKDCGVCR